jgi:hypothetical protein
MVRPPVRIRNLGDAQAHVDMVHQDKKDGQAPQRIYAVDSSIQGDVLA